MPYLILENGDLSQAQITSKSTTVKETDVVQINIDWSGAQLINGTLSVQASLDEKQETWFDLDFGTTISISGVSGEHQVIVTQVSFLHLRIVYDRTNAGATGTINAKIFATTKGA